MLILIAEAKTMLSDEREITPKEFEVHAPSLGQRADEVMARLAEMSVGEIASLTGLGPSLAARLFKYAYNFPDKRLGYPVIEAFTGVVFKALDYTSLSAEAKERCDSDVRIISSLYGWLRPSDIIKPYRLDYTSRLPQGDDAVTVNQFWRKDVTIRLVKELKDSGHNEILNLLPGDAAKLVDWKLVKNFAKVWKADFTDVISKATPSASKLKDMRGRLLRQILEEGIPDAASLTRISSESFLCDGTPVYPDHLHFLC